MPQPSVHQVFQSHDGYLWLATEGGVARFDGYGFKTYNHQTEPTFASDDVSAIAETSGGLWFSTANGLLNFQRSTWRLLGEREGLSSSTVLSLAAAGDGSLLVLTPRGVDWFDGARFRALAIGDDRISALQPTQDGAALLLGEGSVWKFQSGAIQRLDSAAAKLLTVDRDVVIQGVQGGPGGATWTRTTSSVFVRAPALQRVFRSGRELPRGRITALCVDRQGTGWIGTNHGLFFLKLGLSAQLQAVESLRLESVLSIFEDREGNLWIGTETSGLHALRPRKFHAEPAAAGEAVSAGTVLPDGTLWFGIADDGVRRVRNGVAEQPIPADLLTSPVVLAMAHGRNGDIWVGTPDGLNRIAGKRVDKWTSATGLPDDYVRSVLVDTPGTVWASTRRGLAHLEDKRLHIYTRMDGLGSDSIGPVVEAVRAQAEAAPSATPDFWIGTAAGLSHLHHGRIDNFTAGSGSSSTVVTALAQETDGSLWVGLHGRGLFLFAANRFTPVYTKGVPVEVTALAVSTSGHLWIRAMRQVYRASLSALHACAEQASGCANSFEEYGVADGLPSETLSSQGVSAIWQGRDSSLWFPTRKGIGVVDPEHLPLNWLPPPVVIQQMLVDETEIPLTGANSRLSSGHNRYTFSYAALSYTLPARNRYCYKLEGFDKQWVKAGTARTASYTSLRPRAYRFLVEAQNNDGVWSVVGADLRFEVLPPVYQTWWFFCLAVFAMMTMALTVFWLQKRAVQRRFHLVLAERNRIARDVHDTLAQDLVSVSLQLNLAERYLQTNQVDKAVSQLDGTRRLVTTGLKAVRQSIWNLRADPGEDSLPTRLTELARQYAQTDASLQLNIGGAFRRLSPRVEAEVLRIAQEGLSNVYRHAKATEVSVALTYSTGTLSLHIRDNGGGFSTDEARAMQGHYGLLGMQERADALGARLTVTSGAGAGTVVCLDLPLGGKEHRTS